MKKGILKSFIIISLMLLLTSCGGGGSGSDTTTPTTTNPETNTTDTPNDNIASTKAIINLDVEDTNITNLEEYTIVTDNQEVKANEVSTLSLEKDTKDVITLVDEFDEPILMGVKYGGDTEIDISMESTAEMIVLRSPRFIGTEPNNPKELSNRIRNHKDFEELVTELDGQIKIENPCPLSRKCNSYVFRIANNLANDLELDDLYTGVE
jgi:hypothetical protein